MDGTLSLAGFSISTVDINFRDKIGKIVSNIANIELSGKEKQTGN